MAVPFLLIAPDAIASGFGDAGTASYPDAYSMHWNAAKYAFIPSKKGIGATYTPWMRQLVDDRNLFYVSGYTQLSEWETISASIKYYSMGEYLLNDQTGSTNLPYTPNEWSVDAAYIRKLFDFLSAAITFRGIYSGLKPADYFEGNDNSTFGIAADAAFYYRAPLYNGNELSVGLTASNLGPSMNYGGYSLPLPSTLHLGAAYTLLKEGTRISFLADFSRLLVHVDDPGNQYTVSGGVECAFMEKFMLRAGYHQEKNQRYFTAGFGIGFNNLNVDFSYLRSPELNNPLQNTLRFGLAYNLPRQ